MSDKRRRREQWLIWHRMKGHRVIKGFSLLSPMTVYKCETCDMVWTRSLL